MLHAIMRKAAMLMAAIFGFTALSLAQTVTGTVTDKKGDPLPGVTVTIKGTKNATSTNNQGVYTLNNVGTDAVLRFTGAGISAQDVAVGGKPAIDAQLETSVGNLNEVVVVGYGTARRKDLTGSVSTVSAKDFNKGIQTAPDQLIQGKIAGVQVINNSGMPGGSTTIRIRGASSIRAGNQPLFVVDGVPLDNSNARPGASDYGVGDKSQGGNPLNFINPADIASIDVLKDASATAIFGSRGANGVVLITTKKAQGGVPRIEFNASVGVSKVMKKLKVLGANEYRSALGSNNLTNLDEGASVDAFDSITRTAVTQNYGVAVSSGTESAKYRISLGYLDQQGIVRKTGLKKYTASLGGNFKFLESKILGLDINIIASQAQDISAPISNNSGFRGSLIGQALQWNPTRSLRKADGSLNVTRGGDIFNPLASSEAYNDLSKVSTILASISPSIKLTKDLEYKLVASVNYGTGVRRTWIANFINYNDPRPIQRQVFTDISGKDSVGALGGYARLANNETISEQLTHTLTYNTNVSSSVSLNALVGMEYLKYDNRSNGMNAVGFPDIAYPYYDYFQSTNPEQIRHEFNYSPTAELQSYFGRATVNISDRYLLTGTFRRDGSSKFGSNNKYGNFPSFAAAWNISKEEFAKSNFASNLKLRLSWGKTGNQEFPAGASQRRFNVGAFTISNGVVNGSLTRDQIENPDLKWETSTTSNAGLDFTVWNNRISGSVDYFRKSTKDILFLKDAADPVIGGGKKWVNLPGEVLNTGVEVALNVNLINNDQVTWDFGVNATFLKNVLKNFGAPLEAGEIHGQGLSGVRSQLFANDQPLNVFYLKTYQGIDANKIGIVPDVKSFVGSPNPKVLLGISTRASYGKLALEVNMNGAFGHMIYNNTANAILTINNLGAGKNTTAEAVAAGESLASPIAASTRYLEKGDYLKLANATLSYRLGNMNFVKGASIFITGQNLFVITGYSGFDPEINTDKTYNDLPSFGIEYTPYPSARSVTLGVNFSF
jgi:TonB-linked SusC/RagA family outer membrane protein